MFKSSKKKLIISGCSYTHNYAKTQKLEEFPIWGELLADKLDMELINLSRCGFGNRAIYTTLVEKIGSRKKCWISSCYVVRISTNVLVY